MQLSFTLAAITGASSGIGAEFARILAARGTNLILIARRTDRLQALAADLSAKHGTRCEILTADLHDAGDLERVAERLTAAAPDLLINNAGFGVAGTFVKSEVEGQMNMHRLHVLATLRLTHAVLPGMVARGAGGVINVASVAGFLTSPGAVGYGSSKCWIHAFTEGLWMELRGAGSPVRMQALCPGFTYSEFHDAAGMDRSKLAPKSWWFPAEQVVADSLAGLERDRIFVIPGLRYRILVGVTSWLPRPLRRALLLATARRNGRMATAR